MKQDPERVERERNGRKSKLRTLFANRAFRFILRWTVLLLVVIPLLLTVWMMRLTRQEIPSDPGAVGLTFRAAIHGDVPFGRFWFGWRETTWTGNGYHGWTDPAAGRRYRWGIRRRKS